MKKYKHILSVAVAALMLASCSNDIELVGGEPLPDGKYPLAFTASMQGMTSRAGGDKTAWNVDDAIGVRIGDATETGKYIIKMADGSSIVPATPLYWQNTAQAEVTAWYPYNAIEVNLADQSSAEFAPVDFLRATTSATFRDNINLSFSHRMAKVKIELKNEAGISEADWQNVKVKIYGYTSAASDADGNLTGSAEGWITPGAEETWIMPQDMTGKQLFRVTADINGQSKTFAYTPATTANGNITAGTIHSYTITVKRDHIEVQSVTGGEWTDSGDENIGSIEVSATYTANQLKPGDYFYRKEDGNWATSDGGLRATYANGSIMVENMPIDTNNGICIGIVFYVGHNTQDQSDYSQSGINQKKCHGYVVALTDVGRANWDDGTLSTGVSTNETDWNGYFNQKILEGIDIDQDKAAEVCRNYGTDSDGKYAAPTRTSGWFLPSCGQLRYLYSNRTLLSNQMSKCKEKMQDNNIAWFKTNWCYWSSSESDDYYAWSICFKNGDVTIDLKNNAFDVRAVLAF